MFATKSFRALGLSVLICVSLSLLGELTHHPVLLYIFKPLATILILGLPLSQWLKQRSSYALLIGIGLFFSLLGDGALLFPERYFLHGLVFFLLAHFIYLLAFSRNMKFPAHPGFWIFYFAFAAALCAFLIPNLPSTLKIPVALYAILLSSMAAQAMGRFLILKTRPARGAAIGALFFMLSDSLLSLDRFHSAILLAPVVILIPYYLAQWLIALSTVSNHTRPSAPLSS
jgi:uncharacterized membrane protein YhhN